MYPTKEKNCYSECYKNVLYAGPKSAENISTNLSPNPARNPARLEKPGLQLWVDQKNLELEKGYSKNEKKAEIYFKSSPNTH